MFSRWDRIRKTLMKEVGDIIHHHIKHPGMSGMVSVTDVELSNDYKNAKIYVSVYGSDEQKEKTMEALKASAAFVRGEVGKRIRLRYTPEISFHIDNSLERGVRLTNLIDKISKGEI